MSNKLSRRQVLASSALTLAGAIVRAAPPGPGRGLLSIKQLLKFGMFQDDALTIEDKFEILKEIGFDGVEMDSPSDLKPDEVITAQDKIDLEIPGVIDSIHWRKTLSDPDPRVRAGGVLF